MLKNLPWYPLLYHPTEASFFLFSKNSIEKFKYYGHYSQYRMNTTIQISKETKNLIGSFGNKEDTYEEIIKRMYDLAVKEQLHQFLMSSNETLTLEEARELINS